MVSLRIYIATRALLTIPTIIILLTIVFVIMRILPGDPVTAIVGMKAPPEQIQELKKELGLIDEFGKPIPLYIQYLNYFSGIIKGDFGRSLIWGKRPVIIEILEHFPATIELSIMGFIVSLLIGLISGVYSAHKYSSWMDSTIRIYGIISYALFIPWIGMLFQMFFGVQLKILPVAGRIDPGMEPQQITGLFLLDSIITSNWPSFISSLKHLILPSITLGIVLSGIFTRLTRGAMLEVLSQDFIIAAKARGLPNRKILLHALKNAFIPILTMMGLQFALLLTGAILTETTFSWPGIGTFLMERINYRDYTTVQGTVVFFAIIISLVSLIVDLIYAYIDPRIRY